MGAIVGIVGNRLGQQRAPGDLRGRATLGTFSPRLISPRRRGLMRGSTRFSFTLSSVFSALSRGAIDPDGGAMGPAEAPGSTL